jgi:hypothetical protein
LAEDGHESDAGITCHAEGQPCNHDIENCSVDMKQEQRETGEKEEKRDMNKYRHHSGYLVKVPLVESLGVVSTNSSSVAWAMSSLSCLKVGLSPLLYKYRQESPGKTHDEAKKPERVDQDCKFPRRKARWIRRGWLSGGIGEHMIYIPEIER